MSSCWLLCNCIQFLLILGSVHVCHELFSTRSMVASLVVNLFNRSPDLILDLLDSVLLLSWVKIWVVNDSIGELVRLDLNLVLHFALSVSLLRLSFDHVVDALHSILFLLMILLFSLVLSMLRKRHNVSVGQLLPLLHVDLFAEIKFALDTPENLLENLVREVRINNLVHLVLGDLALAESEGCVLDHGTHLLGKLSLHGLVDLVVDLLLRDLVLLHGRLLVELGLFLQVRFHFLHARAKLLHHLLQLGLRLLLALTAARFQLCLDLHHCVFEVDVLLVGVDLVVSLGWLLLGLFLLFVHPGDWLPRDDVFEHARHVPCLIVLSRQYFLDSVEHGVLFGAHLLLVVFVYGFGCFVFQLVLVGQPHGSAELLSFRLREGGRQALSCIALRSALCERRSERQSLSGRHQHGRGEQYYSHFVNNYCHITEGAL